MHALKKQRNKHSSRSADLRLRQPFSSWCDRLASATPANTPNEKIHDFKTKYGNSDLKFGLFAGHEARMGR